MDKRRNTFKFLKAGILITDNTILFIGKGDVKIKLIEIRKIFAEVGEKEMIKRKENKINCSDGDPCLGAINNFVPLAS